MNKRTIYMTESDLRRLQPLVESARSYGMGDQDALERLQEEMDRAVLCDPMDLPEDTVTMNARVTVTDLDTKRQAEYTLVFPRDANYEKHKISVLAPIGTALLGYRRGAEVEWPTPGGVRRLRIDNVTQPVFRRAAKIA